MASRSFNGTSDYIRCSSGALTGAPFTHGTLAILCRRNTANGIEQELLELYGPMSVPYIGFDSTDHVHFQSIPSPTAYTQTTWLLIVITRASGTTTLRYHVFNYAAGTWSHENSISATANDPYNVTTAEFGRWVVGSNYFTCLLYTSPSPRDLSTSRMPSSA